VDLTSEQGHSIISAFTVALFFSMIQHGVDAQLRLRQGGGGIFHSP